MAGLPAVVSLVPDPVETGLGLGLSKKKAMAPRINSTKAPIPINRVRGSDFLGAVAKIGWVLAVVGADVVGLGGGVGGTEALVIEDRAVKVAGGGVAGDGVGGVKGVGLARGVGEGSGVVTVLGVGGGGSGAGGADCKVEGGGVKSSSAGLVSVTISPCALSLRGWTTELSVTDGLGVGGVGGTRGAGGVGLGKILSGIPDTNHYWGRYYYYSS